MVAAVTSAGVAAVASDGMTKDEIRMRKADVRMIEILIWAHAKAQSRKGFEEAKLVSAGVWPADYQFGSAVKLVTSTTHSGIL